MSFNTEKFTSEVAELYNDMHKKHVDVIRRYSEGLLTFDAYKELDTAYDAQKKAIAKVSGIYFTCKGVK